MRLADPQLRERLAAEYALGTLRGRARANLQRRLRDDPALAASVTEWEARLSPMGQALPPVEPPARVWRGVEARLEQRGRGGEHGEGIGARLRFWRALGLVASGACAAFVAISVILLLQKPVQPASYLAVLSDPKTARAVLVVTAPRTGHNLEVKTLDPAIHVQKASLELWAVPRTGKPRSLGLVAQGTALIRLAAAADQSLSDVPMLAVSLEPEGGSRTGAPSGPVLYSGACVKYW